LNILLVNISFYKQIFVYRVQKVSQSGMIKLWDYGLVKEVQMTKHYLVKTFNMLDAASWNQTCDIHLQCLKQKNTLNQELWWRRGFGNYLKYIQALFSNKKPHQKGWFNRIYNIFHLCVPTREK